MSSYTEISTLPILVAQCQAVTGPHRRFRPRLKLFSLDSTVIVLSLSLFEWARYRPKKGGVKLHLLLDHDGYMPVFARIEEACVHDVNIARTMRFPPGSVLAVDRGYYAYDLFAQWTRQGVYFVTREKRASQFRVIETRVPPNGVISDEVIELERMSAWRRFPHRLRRVTMYDPKNKKTLVFISNHLDFPATTICQIYKERWQIELFFKALKQNLRIKSFVGTTENALMTQIWTALIAIVLLKFLKLKSRFGWSLSNLVAHLRWNLFTYRDLWEWIHNPFETPPWRPSVEQLELDLPGIGQLKGGRT